MAIPKVDEILGVPPPAFVRKLVRASHWGDPEDDIQQRVETAVSEVFRPSDARTFSVYLVERDADLYRVAIGLNASRSSLTETLVVVAFPQKELTECGISPESAPGETKCSGANRRHFDFSATQMQLAELCRRAMQQERAVGRFKKRHLQPIVAKAAKDGCRAVVAESVRCACDDE